MFITVLKEIPNHLPKKLFSISAEHASQDEKIGSIFKLYVDVVVLMNEVDGLISAMNRAIFC